MDHLNSSEALSSKAGQGELMSEGTRRKSKKGTHVAFLEDEVDLEQAFRVVSEKARVKNCEFEPSAPYANDCLCPQDGGGGSSLDRRPLRGW